MKTGLATNGLRVWKSGCAMVCGVVVSASAMGCDSGSSGGFEDGGGSAANVECGVLRAGESLAQGDEVRSCNGRYNFIHQGDGNVVLYDGSTPLFNTHTDGKSSASMELRTDGNFVLTSPSGEVLFSTETSGSGFRFVMQDDGNGVIYDPSDNPVWATGTSGGGSSGGDEGCSADVDCGSCERCELSTGNCLSRPSCAAEDAGW